MTAFASLLVVRPSGLHSERDQDSRSPLAKPVAEMVTGYCPCGMTLDPISTKILRASRLEMLGALESSTLERSAPAAMARASTAAVLPTPLSPTMTVSLPSRSISRFSNLLQFSSDRWLILNCAVSCILYAPRGRFPMLSF